MCNSGFISRFAASAARLFDIVRLKSSLRLGGEVWATILVATFSDARRFRALSTGKDRTERNDDMNDKTDRIIGILWLALGALLVGMILAAPVMREPRGTISATDYFGEGR